MAATPGAGAQIGGAGAIVQMVFYADGGYCAYMNDDSSHCGHYHLVSGADPAPPAAGVQYTMTRQGTTLTLQAATGDTVTLQSGER